MPFQWLQLFERFLVVVVVAMDLHLLQLAPNNLLALLEIRAWDLRKDLLLECLILDSWVRPLQHIRRGSCKDNHHNPCMLQIQASLNKRYTLSMHWPNISIEMWRCAVVRRRTSGCIGETWSNVNRSCPCAQAQLRSTTRFVFASSLTCARYSRVGT